MSSPSSCGVRLSAIQVVWTQRRVALDEGQAAERPVALVRRLEPQRVEVEVLVLERVGELVGVGHPLDRPERRPVRRTTNSSSLSGDVVAGDLARLQLERSCRGATRLGAGARA